MTTASIYVALARLTVLAYLAMALAAAADRQPRAAGISFLFACANALIFW